MIADKQFSIRLTQASLNQTAMDIPRNMANIYTAIDKAVAEGADELDLAELTLTSYGCNDDFQKTDNTKVFRWLSDIATYAQAKDPNLIVKIGFPWRLAMREVPQLEQAFMDAGLGAEYLNNPLFNREDLPFNMVGTIARGDDGRVGLQAMTAKMYLFNYERGYEKRNLQQWNMMIAQMIGGTHGTISAPLPDGRMIPVGRPVIQYYDEEQDLRENQADSICEDNWLATKFGGAPYTDDAYEKLGVIPNIARYVGSTKGLVINVAEASPPAGLKIDRHLHLARLGSRNGITIVKTDDVGTSDATFAQSGHRIIAQDGKIISYGERNSMARVATTSSTIRIDSAPAETAKKAHIILRHHFKNAAKAPEAHIAYEAVQNDWDDPANPGRPYEEAARMTALWLFDYMRKNKTQGIAEAQSGGGDSGFNSMMIRVTVELAMKELGVEGFLREMKHLKYADAIRAANRTGGADAAIKVCMDNMLTSVYMGTNNSGQKTFNAAKTLIEGGVGIDGQPVEGIGGKFMSRNVQDLLDFYAVNMAVENTTTIHGPSVLAQSVADLARDAQGLLDQDPAALPAGEHKAKVDALKGRFDSLLGQRNEYQDWSRKNELTRAVSDYLNQRELKKDATPAEVKAHLQKLDEQQAALRARFPELKGRLISAADPRDSVAYENIQARARQVLIMLIANDENKMSIANPNLNEAYNAYATFGGDLHAGTVNLNGFAFKDFELAIMRHLHDNGLRNAIAPIRGIGLTLGNPPSAELKKPGENGELLQTDEDELQRTFPQMSAISVYMNHEKIRTADGERLMNAGEIFDRLQQDDRFKGVDENRLYNMLKVSYFRWSVAQHKIHASPIGPTFGFNVDHQVSRRTPNLSGWSKDELAVLGIEVMRKWEKDDGIAIDGLDSPIALKRAEQDETFIELYEGAIRNRNKASKMDYDLKGLYDRVRELGWDTLFPPLPPESPIMYIQNYLQQPGFRPS